MILSIILTYFLRHPLLFIKIWHLYKTCYLNSEVWIEKWNISVVKNPEKADTFVPTVERICISMTIQTHYRHAEVATNAYSRRHKA